MAAAQRGRAAIAWTDGGKRSSRGPGWWYTYPSEKYEFVSWGYYSQYMETNVPNHQPAVYGNDRIKNDQHQCWMLIRWRLFHLAYGIVIC
jgi:hypothetical protein